MLKAYSIDVPLNKVANIGWNVGLSYLQGFGTIYRIMRMFECCHRKLETLVPLHCVVFAPRLQTSYIIQDKGPISHTK